MEGAKKTSLPYYLLLLRFFLKFEKPSDFLHNFYTEFINSNKILLFLALSEQIKGNNKGAYLYLQVDFLQ